MLIQCQAEGVAQFPANTQLNLIKARCDSLYPAGNECYENRDDYYY